MNELRPKLKIAIVGGGICGVSAANALQEKLSCSTSITIYESDPCSLTSVEWLAATARNANTSGMLHFSIFQFLKSNLT